jgi:hypothetical protein
VYVDAVRRVECSWEDLPYDSDQPARSADGSVAIAEIALDEFVRGAGSPAWIILPSVAGNLFDHSPPVETEEPIAVFSKRTDMKKIVILRGNQLVARVSDTDVELSGQMPFNLTCRRVIGPAASVGQNADARFSTESQTVDVRKERCVVMKYLLASIK